MRRVLRFEHRRMLLAKSYRYSLLFGGMMALWHFVECFIIQRQYTDEPLPLIQSFLGGDIQTSIPELYRIIIPLLATIPYAWGYMSDYKSGYLKSLYLYVDRMKLLTARYLVCVEAGGLCAVFPLIFSLILSAPFYPNYKPRIFLLYGGPPAGSAFADSYYLHPLLYIMFYMLLAFIIGCIFASIGLLFGLFVKSRIQVLAIPMLLLLYWSAVCQQLGIKKISFKEMLLPFEGVWIGPFFLIVGVCIVTTFLLFTYIGKRKDVLGDM